MGSRIARKVIELSVSAALKEFAGDGPPRTLARLLMSGDILPLSDLPQDMRSLLESMLSDPRHPYCAALSRAAKDTDRKHFTDFAVNLGYEGISCGGSLLRQELRKSGTCLPWILGVELSSASSELLRIPVSMGIACYVLLCADGCASDLVSLCRAYPQAAFFAALPDARISEDLLHALEGANNLFLLPVVRGMHFTSGPVIRACRRLYSPLFLLDAEDTDRMVRTGDYACPEDPEIFLGLYLPRTQVPQDLRAAFTDFMLRARLRASIGTVPMLPAMDIPGIQKLVTGSDVSGACASPSFSPPLLYPDAALACRLEAMI